MTAPRWFIIRRGVGIGLIVIIGFRIWADHTLSYAACRAHLDAQLRHTNPRLLAILQSNPALNAEINEKTRIVFDHAGGAAATATFWNLVNYRLTRAAGDDAIRACHAAWTQAFAQLASQPHLCRQFAGGDISVLPAEDPRLAAVNDACDRAMQDGFSHLDAPPPMVYGNDFQAVSDRAASGPEPPTAEDNAAWHDAAHASDQAMCNATIKFSRNIDALPDPLGPTYMRSQYGASGNAKFSLIIPPAPNPPAPESDLHCAPAGTRFVLNNFLNDGRPNSWTSLGRHGFDCAINSAATGKRGLFNTLGDDLTPFPVPNRMRILWPLTPGKSYEIHYSPVDGYVDEEKVTVLAKARYWLPWGSVDAYTIQRDIYDGANRYVIVDYWSNELGFMIGRRSYAIRGRVPASAGIDFQLVAMLPPAGAS